MQEKFLVASTQAIESSVFDQGITEATAYQQSKSLVRNIWDILDIHINQRNYRDGATSVARSILFNSGHESYPTTLVNSLTGNERYNAAIRLRTRECSKFRRFPAYPAINKQCYSFRSMTTLPELAVFVR